MDEKTLFDLMRAWLLEATRLPDILEAPVPKAAPAGAYGVLNLISTSARGAILSVAEEANPLYTDGVDPDIYPFHRVTKQNQTWLYSFTIIARDATTIMQRLEVYRKTAEGAQRTAPLIFSKMSDIRRLTDVDMHEWHMRAVADLTIGAVVSSGTQGAAWLGGVPFDVITQQDDALLINL